MQPELKWEPNGLVCLHCGTPNPDKGDRCGNCGQNPFVLPKILTEEQLTIQKAVANKWKRHRSQIRDRGSI